MQLQLLELSSMKTSLLLSQCGRRPANNFLTSCRPQTKFPLTTHAQSGQCMRICSSGSMTQRGIFLNQGCASIRDCDGNLVSELDFRSQEVKRRIINMDETHHDLSVTGDRGVSIRTIVLCPLQQAQSMATPPLLRRRHALRRK